MSKTSETKKVDCDQCKWRHLGEQVVEGQPCPYVYFDFHDPAKEGCPLFVAWDEEEQEA